MARDQNGLSMVEYIVLGALIMAVVGAATWQLAGAIAQRFDDYQDQM
jgi:Flp pilus assembly pilin Flp